MLQKAQQLLVLKGTHYGLTEKAERGKPDHYSEASSQVGNRETFAQAQDSPIFHAYGFNTLFKPSCKT